MGRCQSRIKFLNPPEGLRIEALADALCNISRAHARNLHRLDYEFVSREKILDINANHLNHFYQTDVITFDYSEGSKLIGEVFMCLDVIQDNARSLKIDAQKEIERVVFHGILHLLGFNDSCASEIVEMRQKEEECLMLVAI